jgi:hypothetical protein
VRRQIRRAKAFLKRTIAKYMVSPLPLLTFMAGLTLAAEQAQEAAEVHRPQAYA